MITLFQITGSSSFVARAALECAGAEYEVVNVHPRRRDEAPGFADANPLQRVPALREGSDEGEPIVVAHPDDEAAQVIRAIAEKIDVELAPRKVYRPELKIV